MSRGKVSRRKYLVSAGTTIACALAPATLLASPTQLRTAIRSAFPNTPISSIKEGRVAIDLPVLAENGNSVRLRINVESPMTASDYVTTIHVFAPSNPLPDIARFNLSPHSGDARIETRIRISQEQDIVVIAQMNDASVWSGSAHIVVTEAACIDALI